MQKLLEFCEREDGSWEEGAMWAVALAVSELMRTLFFCMCWSISYRTATRLRAACLGMVYRKILALQTLGNKSAGEVVHNLSYHYSARYFYQQGQPGNLITLTTILLSLWSRYNNGIHVNSKNVRMQE